MAATSIIETMRFRASIKSTSMMTMHIDEAAEISASSVFFPPQYMMPINNATAIELKDPDSMITITARNSFLPSNRFNHRSPMSMFTSVHMPSRPVPIVVDNDRHVHLNQPQLYTDSQMINVSEWFFDFRDAKITRSVSDLSSHQRRCADYINVYFLCVHSMLITVQREHGYYRYEHFGVDDNQHYMEFSSKLNRELKLTSLLISQPDITITFGDKHKPPAEIPEIDSRFSGHAQWLNPDQVTDAHKLWLKFIECQGVMDGRFTQKKQRFDIITQVALFHRCLADVNQREFDECVTSCWRGIETMIIVYWHRLCADVIKLNCPHLTGRTKPPKYPTIDLLLKRCLSIYNHFECDIEVMTRYLNERQYTDVLLGKVTIKDLCALKLKRNKLEHTGNKVDWNDVTAALMLFHGLLETLIPLKFDFRIAGYFPGLSYDGRQVLSTWS